MTNQLDDPFAILDKLAQSTTKHTGGRDKKERSVSASDAAPAFSPTSKLDRSPSLPLEIREHQAKPAQPASGDAYEPTGQLIPINVILLDPDQPRGVLRAIVKDQLIENPLTAIVKLTEMAESGDLAALYFVRGIEELASDIAQHGLLQPVSVVSEGGAYRLLFGERRVLAHALMLYRKNKGEWDRIRAVIYDRDTCPNKTAAWSENLKRHQVPAIVLMKLAYELYLGEINAMKSNDYYAAQDRLKSEIVERVALLYKERTGEAIAIWTVRTWVSVFGGLNEQIFPLAAAYNFPYRFLVALSRCDKEQQMPRALSYVKQILGEGDEQPAKQRVSNVTMRHRSKLAKQVEQIVKLNGAVRRMARNGQVSPSDMEALLQQAISLKTALETCIATLQSACAVR